MARSDRSEIEGTRNLPVPAGPLVTLLSSAPHGLPADLTAHLIVTRDRQGPLPSPTTPRFAAGTYLAGGSIGVRRMPAGYRTTRDV